MAIKMMTFEQWKEANSDLTPDGEIWVDCDVCDGDGEVTCRYCGHDHDCDDCGGSGKVKKDPTLLDMYNDQIRLDRQAVARFVKKYPNSSLSALLQ